MTKKTEITLAVFLLLGMAVLVSDLIRYPYAFFEDVSPEARFLLIVVGCLVYSGLVALIAALTRLFSCCRKLCPLIFAGWVASGSACLLLFIFFILTHPRLNWGDAVWVIELVRQGTLGAVDRWLLGTHVMTWLYYPLRGSIDAGDFLILLFCALGAVEFLFLKSILKSATDDSEIQNDGLLLCLSSYGTLCLMSGYIEIYPLAQFGFLLFLTAGLRLLKGPSFISAFAFGLVHGIAPFLYFGLLPMLACGCVVVFFGIISHPRLWQSTATGCAMGLLLGTWAVASVLNIGFISTPWAAWRYLLITAQPLLQVSFSAEPTSWYVSQAEIFSPVHLKNILHTLLIYGPFGLLLAVWAGACLLASLRKKNDGCGQPISPSLLMVLFICGCSAVFLPPLLVKRHVLEFADWDLFSYAAVGFNLSGVFLLAALAKRQPYCKKILRGVRHAAVIWLFFIYAFMSPFSKSLILLPSKITTACVPDFDFFKLAVNQQHSAAIAGEVRSLASRLLWDAQQ